MTSIKTLQLPIKNQVVLLTLGIDGRIHYKQHFQQVIHTISPLSFMVFQNQLVNCFNIHVHISK